MSNKYHLGHDSTEAERLEKQSALFSPQDLEHLLASAKNCLEIGCGVGSNLKRFKTANPNIHYTGIDISEQAIATFNKKFPNDSSIHTQAMDATKLTFASQSFDLVISNLVLWATGPKVEDVCKEVHRVLKPKGAFLFF
jgi:ubiquinone/menaquinone biosynthesis C-methylase UbiE